MLTATPDRHVRGVHLAASLPLRRLRLRQHYGLLHRGHRGGDAMREQVGTALLLDQWRGGEQSSADELVRRLYPELSQIAAARLRGERNTSLSTSDLINEAVLRLIRKDELDIVDRVHFIALSSRLMRNILVDHVREKNAAKRQHVRVELCTMVEGGDRFDLTKLNSALIRLGAIDPYYLELVEMRYFGGMTIADIALVTSQSSATVERRWQVARAWLLDALSEQIGDD